MNRKVFITIMFILLFCVSLNNLVFSSVSDSSLINLVKEQKNLLNIPCSRLPEIINQSVIETNNKMTQKRESDMTYKWSASRTGSEDKVLLSVDVVTHVSIDSMTMSYSWNPRFEWIVDAKNNKVTPANRLTWLWMETGKLQKQ
ncbi:MAG: hypothetical protein ABIH22_01230 [Candidatus Margulisiibacteriota bacterium]